MRCPRCQADNREGRRFCGLCGLSLRITCEGCGFENQPSDRFCGGCGRGLTSGSTIHPEADLPDPARPNHASPTLGLLAALKAELPPAPSDFTDALSDLDLTELDDRFIEGEP